MLVLYRSQYELFTVKTESQVTNCHCGYQTFSSLQLEALFFLNISIFWFKIQHFSTFGSNQDDHEDIYGDFRGLGGILRN